LTEQDFKRKSPATQRTIADIKSGDERIQVTGFIKEILSDENFILKDDTGEISVFYKEVNFPLKKDLLINVIGDFGIIDAQGEKKIEAEIIQDMQLLNFEYYEKIYELKKEFL